MSKERRKGKRKRRN
ncbi:hypothetical protein OIU74_028433 [Salix koriyanagi]|uniref:Uncharacterized protein n=1 Tax=Salix koriyanagi TaxID=2511006 RepID=A0A9Q0VDV3_9ROSI|nr:hypothetical protein OIU74_028433 [Salix koriyanagi]